MQTSIQIIEEIKVDAASLQRKFLTLPAPGETINKKQQEMIDKVRNSLEGWRNWDLGELEKAFKE